MRTADALRTAQLDLARENPVYLAKLLSPPGAYWIRAHHRLIGRELAALQDGTTDRLILNTPPQIGKSTLAAVWFPLWWLVHHPRDRVIIGSYGDDLAEEHGRKTRDLITEHNERIGLDLVRGSSAVKHWTVEEGGGLRSVGIGSGLTGHGAKLAICDDPHKDRKEADSLTVRKRAWDWWSSTFLSRLAPGAPIVLVQTRWHEDDLTGRVLAQEGRVEEGGRWRVVHLPALADPALTPHGDPLGRAPGAPLTHPELDDADTEALLAHWEEKRSTSTPRDWGALYQGNPQPREGALITQEQLVALRLRAGEAAPKPVRKAVAVDPSGGAKDTAGIVAGYTATDGRLYVTHDRTKACPSHEWSRLACMLAYETEASMFFIERYGGDQSNLTVRTAWEALQREGKIPQNAPCPYLADKTAKAGKLLRAEPIAQQMLEGRIRFTTALVDLEREWATWQPSSESPGRIDAMSYLAYGLLKVPGANKLVGSPVGTSLSGIASSGMGSLGRRG